MDNGTSLSVPRALFLLHNPTCHRITGQANKHETWYLSVCWKGKVGASLGRVVSIRKG